MVLVLLAVLRIRVRPVNVGQDVSRQAHSCRHKGSRLLCHLLSMRHTSAAGLRQRPLRHLMTAGRSSLLRRLLLTSDREGVGKRRIRSRLLLRHCFGASVNTFARLDPEGPSTQCLRSLVPNTIKSMVFGTRDLKYCVLGPSG